MRIVSITLSASEKRYWLELDDGRRLGLSPTVYLASGYGVDNLISESDWERLVIEEERVRLRKAALAILDYSDRTEADLRRRLHGDPHLIQEILSDLRAMGIVDDQRYVEQAAERHLRRGGVGKKKLQYQLQRSGVAPELITKAVDKIDDEMELAAAVDYVRRHLHGYDLTDRTVVRRVYTGLLRRGFHHEIARSAIRVLERESQNNADDGLHY